ncbi:hypothetical protein Kpol_1076p8 [Vanderwaltozyma polyspora DSM 70294]|uniref:polynucleotide adenylyltransferase n=1 Tax=Vanderwaltozyma polyspora (strain ATCC 22028 / DSM 70294 / BCRC 21397 / CBS 2163 / NBRC 10782 / NRRL Y-8283 / UCD 57-17) TaxID=436907 RepID=A7TSF9_VANPO|nr:uncharacterized protein Kpol_1076p8 [Vanderwaltozyma polyspora DSM 70294]EDO14802.1 hypothetical protein Kpol_1076p8 [Vanderwaltozyma polyspora DSM 70294]
MSTTEKNKDIVIINDNVSEENDDYDDYDGHIGNPLTISDSSAESNNGDNKVPKLRSDIDTNNDFIAFSDSSEDEKENDDINEKESKDEDANILNMDFPWTINRDHSKQKEIADWLTLEIRDFVSYISPNRKEIELRNQTIGKLRDAVQHHWPDANLHVFGSYATDLYLPGSDIDCVVNSKAGDKQSRNCLYSLASHLKKEGLAEDIEIIAKARVPIIKFVEPLSKIHVDVSFERTNGLEAAKLIRGWLDSTNGLRELVLIVKQFLQARRLNKVHTGGLGGFSIICLVYSFLHLHPRILANEINPIENLGVLLIDFFELYGKNFGYDHVALSVMNGKATYLPKSNWKELHPIKSTFQLAIQDPGDATNNISRGSFNIRDIKKAFAGAFDLLTNRCFELHRAKLKDRQGCSILGNVIKYRGKARDFRDERGLVENKAIIENENYHKRRSRIIHGSDNEEEEEEEESDKEDDPYNIEEPPMKKLKRSSSIKEDDGNAKKKPRKERNRRQKEDQDDEEEEDDYNPLKR